MARAAGLQAGPREYVDAQKTEAAFILTPQTAGCTVELIAPKGGNPGLEKFLENNRGRRGCTTSPSPSTIWRARCASSTRGVPLIDKVPRPGARGHMVGFLHPKAADGILIELVSDHAHAHTQGRH